MAIVAFDQTLHQYTDDAGLLVGVTSCLRPLVDPSWFTEEARLRGTNAHAAIARDLDGTPDTDESADWWSRVVAARAWRSENEAVTTAYESVLSDSALRLAGTVDWVGTVRGVPTIVDWKPAADNGVTGLQLAAYAHLQFLTDRVVRQRVCVHLHDDGTYRVQTFADRQDWPVFRALLTVEQWRRAHGR